MARDPESVHQFRALRWLDRFFGSDDAAERGRRYDAALARLDDGGFDLSGPTAAGVEQIADADAAPNPLRHLEDHWLSGRYWPAISADTIKATLQSGYTDAIREAKSLGLPLNSIWVCATDDSKASVFRVDHVAGPTAVTVAIITPKPAA